MAAARAGAILQEMSLDDYKTVLYRQEDGSWGPAINMGDKVNSDKWDAYASVTPDGKYILFNRGVDTDNDNVDIYWVDAKIIETLRPKP